MRRRDAEPGLRGRSTGVKRGALARRAPRSATPALIDSGPVTRRGAVTDAHVFIARGDVTRLSCDAWLLPTDRGLSIEPAWARALPADVRTADGALTCDPPTGWGDEVRSFHVGGDPDGPAPAVWATEVGGHPTTDIAWFVAAAEAFVRGAAPTIGSPRHGRERPLLATPLVGTGGGGGARRKGEVVRALLPALTEAAGDTGVDVVLVTFDDQAFAAAQAARKRLEGEGTLDPWADLDEDLRAAADDLADKASIGQLVLFLGAGVSAGAGLPLWGKLLERLAARIGVDEEGLVRLSRLDALDQARLLAGRVQGRSSLGEHLRDLLEGQRYSLAHALLAGLPTDEVVTVNYDRLFEEASIAAGRRLSVLPYDPAEPGTRWLLKLHGSIEQPDDIVLTRSDYLRYADQRAALAGIVQALLITRHMLFVGFSLNDDNFHRIAEDVRRAVGRDDGALTPFGTTLLLHRDDLLEELWRGDLDCVAMAPPAAADRADAARRLEIVLDRLLARCTSNAGHLLDDDYAALLSEPERELKGLLTRLLAEASPALRSADAWRPVARLLEELGYGRSAGRGEGQRDGSARGAG